MNEFTSERIQKAAAGDQEAITELYELTYSTASSSATMDLTVL